VVASFFDPESLALFQIMPRDAVNFTPLLCAVEMPEWPPLLLRGLLVVIAAVSSVLAITSVNCVDLMIILPP
jgi:hypothetical protein